MSQIRADGKWFKDRTEDKDKRKKSLAAGMVWFDQIRELYDEELQARRLADEQKPTDMPKFDVGTMAYNIGIRKGIGICLGLIPEMKD